MVSARALQYSVCMETVIRNVRELNASDRSAVERIVGHSVREDQRLLIQLTDVDKVATPHETQEDEIPEWWNVYEGLSDEEIEKLDRAIRQRANLTRNFE